MNYKLQIISLFFSFVFGIAFSILIELNQKIISKNKKFLQIILTFIFIIDVVLLYLICVYKINKGIVHWYFVLMVLSGCILEIKCLKVLSRRVKYRKLIDKTLHR